MNPRPAGLAAGALCFTAAYFGAGWSWGAAAATAAFWALMVYAIVRMHDEPWWP